MNDGVLHFQNAFECSFFTVMLLRLLDLLIRVLVELQGVL